MPIFGVRHPPSSEEIATLLEVLTGGPQTEAGAEALAIERLGKANEGATVRVRETLRYLEREGLVSRLMVGEEILFALTTDGLRRVLGLAEEESVARAALKGLEESVGTSVGTGETAEGLG